jgi:GTP pyrophosphokinase
MLKPGNITGINRENLEIASQELWSILKKEIDYLPADDQKLVELAFTEMVIAHNQQKRKNGDFYIVHPTSACLTLARIKLDKNTLCATLLHDVPEDTDTNIKQIEQDFGAEIAYLVYGVTKLSTIKYGKNTTTDDTNLDKTKIESKEKFAENLRRMFIAMSKDLRVIFIKLADRLHNLQTLKSLPIEKARRIALESVEIYAPISERLGMSLFRGEIEDASFPYLYPDEYRKFISLSEIEIGHRLKMLEKIKTKTETLLKKEGIQNFRLEGRAKRYYSLFRKMLDKGYLPKQSDVNKSNSEQFQKPLEQIYDLIALRVIVQNVDQCYEVLAILHRLFTPLEGRLKDYIRQPKENGYQSIQTTVKDKEYGLEFEFQVRTEEMHEFSEYGVAAHWRYKNGDQEGTEPVETINQENLKWINDLVKLSKEPISEEEFLGKVKIDLFEDRIFVLTPKNDAVDLPRGATVLDFAYRIHDQVGDQAVMAKINGRQAKLSEELKSGDQVEIITDKRKKPSRDSLSWVKTLTAARQIRSALRKMGENLPVIKSQKDAVKQTEVLRD